MIEFRQKDFSYLTSMSRGATIGSSVGAITAGANFATKSNLGRKALNNIFGTQFKKKEDDGNRKETLILTAGGAIIGAALGALAETIRKTSEKINRKNTVNNRLMSLVIDNLTKAGFKEGTDFTRDPKISTDRKLKVCIVISRESGELKLLVNTINEPKLKNVTTDIVKRLPNSSVVTDEISDKHNNIMISTISDGSGSDAGFISGIADRFIHEHYPVYLVEVG